MNIPATGGSLLQYAEAYIGLGWSLIPIEPSGKKPLIRWESFQERRASLEEVKKWLSQWPDMNLGMVCGPISAVLVVDIDGDEGRQALLERKMPLPGSMLQKTPHGWHCVYRYPQGATVRNAAGIMPKVDIRAEGGYIVVAPSKLQDGSYQWLGLDKVEKLAEPPRWVVTGRIADPETHERVDMAAVLNGVSEGRRDQELFRLASKLRYADVPFEIAETLVCEAAANCRPPFGARAAREKVLSAYGRYRPTVTFGTDESETKVEIEGKDMVRLTMASPKGPVSMVFAEMEKQGRDLQTEMSIRLLMPGAPSDTFVQRINLLSMSARNDCRRELDGLFGKDGNWGATLSRAAALAKDAYLQIDRSIRACDIADIETLDQLIDPLMPDDGITMIFGPGGGHKTWLLLEAEAAIATGSQMAGMNVQRRNVLHVDCGETGERKWRMRLRRLLGARGISIADSDNIHYLAADGIPLIDLVDSIRRLIDRHNIGFIGADHAAALCLGKVEESDAAKSIGRAQAKIGAPMLLLGHITGEASLEPSQVRRPFGSIFWHNTARQTWYVQSDQAKTSSFASVGVFNRKTNDGIPPQDIGLRITFEDPSGPVNIERGDLRSPKLAEARGVEYVIYQALDTPMTARGIADVTGRSEPEVRKVLNAHASLFKKVSEDRRGQGVQMVWGRAS